MDCEPINYFQILKNRSALIEMDNLPGKLLKLVHLLNLFTLMFEVNMIELRHE